LEGLKSTIKPDTNGAMENIVETIEKMIAGQSVAL
jgi:hypothetical protein